MLDRYRLPVFTATLVVITLLVIAATRPDHSLWSLTGIQFSHAALSFPGSDHLLSFLLVPLIISLTLTIAPATNRKSIFVIALLVGLIGELLQVITLHSTFDWKDLAALISGAVVALPFVQAQTQTTGRAKTIVPLLLALPLQFACYSPPETCSEDHPDKCDTLTWLTWDEIRAEIQPEYGDTVALERPGKLLSGSGELLVVDRYSGFHIFDTNDTQNPVRLAYIPLPGVTDVTSDGEELYANAFSDIVVIPIQPLKDMTYEPGMELRLENQLRFSQYQFVSYSSDRLGAQDTSRLNTGDYGIAIGVDYYDGGSSLYGEVISSEDENPTEEETQESDDTGNPALQSANSKDINLTDVTVTEEGQVNDPV